MATLMTYARLRLAASARYALLGAVAALALGFLMPVQSFACEGRDLVFEDDFKSDLGGWDPNQGLTFGELGGKVIFARHWENVQIMNFAVSPLDGDLCMTASFPAG